MQAPPPRSVDPSESNQPTDVDEISHDPVTQLILDQIDYFGDLAVQRGDEGPLSAFKEITDAFQEIDRCLGTLEHEVALDQLKRGLRSLRGQSASGIKRTWLGFWRVRQRAKEIRVQESVRSARMSAQLENLERSVAAAKDDDRALNESMERALHSFRELARVKVSMSDSYYKLSWFTLLVNLRLLRVYAQYLLNRTSVFLAFHAFVFLVPIAILGIGYSALSKYLIDYIALLASQTTWIVAALTVGAYAIKKYILDKKLKRLQVSFETSLYRRLNVSLLVARTLALRESMVRAESGDA